MTGDQVKGKGFRGALRYNLQKVNNGVAKILDMSFAFSNERSIMQEVALVRMQRPSLQKYFYHTSLNFPPEENLSDEQMNKIANEYLNNSGFVQNQYIIFRHFDADHPHLHILVNRIGYDGSVVSDSQDYKRSEGVLRELEKKYGLTEVISSRQAQERAMTKNEMEMMKRTDEPSIKMKLQVSIKDALNKTPNTEKFIELLEAQGINLLFNQASTGFVSGISYGYEGMQFKGAHLGNAYKWQAIKTSIGYEQERDRAAIHEANIRTKAGRSERAGTAATTQAYGIRADHQLTPGHSKNVQTDAGNLRDDLAKANAANQAKDGRTQQQSGKPAVSSTKNTGQRRTGPKVKQQDRQQVGNPLIPERYINRGLLSDLNDPHTLDEAALRQFKRRRKKRGRSL